MKMKKYTYLLFILISHLGYTQCSDRYLNEIFSAVIQPELISTSTKIGFAPKRTAEETVAIKVLGVVIISSPSLRPIA